MIKRLGLRSLIDWICCGDRIFGALYCVLEFPRNDYVSFGEEWCLC